jgi:hypothetical protein
MVMERRKIVTLTWVLVMNVNRRSYSVQVSKVEHTELADRIICKMGKKDICQGLPKIFLEH